jgi:hypothetical protein
MEFKKCDRCGAFFASNDNVCCNCSTKERAEFSKFKTYIDEINIDNINSLNDLSIGTGISSKTINRFLGHEDFSDIANQINLK